MIPSRLPDYFRPQPLSTGRGGGGYPKYRYVLVLAKPTQAKREAAIRSDVTPATQNNLEHTKWMNLTTAPCRLAGPEVTHLPELILHGAVTTQYYNTHVITPSPA